MQKMSNGDYFDEKMRRGDRSKEARRISPPLKLLLKSPKLRALLLQNPHIYTGAGSKVPCGSGGSSVDPAKKTCAGNQGDKRVSRRSSGATEARRGCRGGFSLSLESESGSKLCPYCCFRGIFVSA